MPPTESQILTSFLLPPAPLSISLSLQQFTDLFPRSQQKDPAIPELYRELQQQRTQDIHEVKQNIANEVKRGEKQSREVRRQRRGWGDTKLEEDEERDLRIEAELFGKSNNAAESTPHTPKTIVSEMEDACADLEAEIKGMEKEAEKLLLDTKTTIGDLSDLRYGRFNRTPGGDNELGQEVVESLKRLEQICDDIGKV